MAITNRQRIDNGLTELCAGLKPYVERELEQYLGDQWIVRLQDSFRVTLNEDGTVRWDSYAILKGMWDQWNTTFRKSLGKTERSYVSELVTLRNAHAHEEKITYEDTERGLDTMRRLLAAAGAAEAANRVAEIRKECIRVQQAEEARRETRKAEAISGNPEAGLKPWREVITPHNDVSQGNYMEAEFAADLNLVHRGGPSVPSEYREPKEFFARTFLTYGLKDLLSIGARRLNGETTDPVVELQTNFGGGKTHSMLALYHLASDAESKDLPGIAEYFAEQNLPSVPQAERAVLVGNNFSAAEVETKSDGCEVHTLWGELAWQLGGAESYKLVEASDKAGTSPGKELLAQVLEKNSPCLVLIDEWVALLRQLPNEGNLAAGTYEANITFAQALTEAAKGVKGALVVASLPVSSIEVGGTKGEQALKELSNVIKRVAKPWRPADSNEGFEIVRRRLFQSTMDFASRDAVVKAFGKLYRDQSGEFPSECREGDYERKLEACYPIHPELFQQFEQGWATLEKFQRTRGILRLMAAVIYELWARGDKSLLIMPSSVTLDSRRVMSLITECLPDGPQWEAIVSKDIDGSDSLPVKTDTAHQNLGRYSAARRVARSIFMGSAPTVEAGSNAGIEDERMRLCCAQPGETVATFGDALKRLTDNAVHLYVDRNRYWYALQPSVTRLAKDRADSFERVDVENEITRRLQLERERGDFAGIHVAPVTSADIPDEMETRLVVLGPAHAQKASDRDSDAMKEAGEILNKRGNSPRSFRNCLLFVAADERRIGDLVQSVREHLAWKSIQEDVENQTQDFTLHTASQVKTKTEETNRTVELRLHEAWSKALVPSQPDPTKPDIDWEIVNVGGDEPLAIKVAKKMVTQESLMTVLGAPRLQMELDRVLWSDTDHIDLKTLSEHLATYLYLPRLSSRRVLQAGIENQISSIAAEYFAYATSYDSDQNKYLGLTTAGFNGNIVFDGSSLLVKLPVAESQIASENAKSLPNEAAGTAELGGAEEENPVEPDTDAATKSAAPKRFYGTINLSPMRAGLQFSDVMQEVVQHFTRDPDNNVTIRVDISADSSEGFSESTIRTAKENANTLGFESHEFSD